MQLLIIIIHLNGKYSSMYSLHNNIVYSPGIEKLLWSTAWRINVNDLCNRKHENNYQSTNTDTHILVTFILLETIH